MPKTIVIERGYCKLGNSGGWVNTGKDNALVIAVLDQNGQQIGEADLMGIYQLNRALDVIAGHLDINRSGWEPDYKALITAMRDDGPDVCDYCHRCGATCENCMFNRESEEE